MFFKIICIVPSRRFVSNLEPKRKFLSWSDRYYYSLGQGTKRTGNVKNQKNKSFENRS